MTAYDRRRSTEIVEAAYHLGFRHGVLLAGSLTTLITVALVGLVWWRLA